MSSVTGDSGKMEKNVFKTCHAKIQTNDLTDLTDLTTEEYNELGTLLYDNFNYELEGKFI